MTKIPFHYKGAKKTYPNAKKKLCREGLMAISATGW